MIKTITTNLGVIRLSQQANEEFVSVGDTFGDIINIASEDKNRVAAVLIDIGAPPVGQPAPMESLVRDILRMRGVGFVNGDFFDAVVLKLSKEFLVVRKPQ